MSFINSRQIRVFRQTVWKYWAKAGRHELPWRKTKDPYRIFVSEMMLQQTQVPRVIEKYKKFLKQFPNVQTLARASLGKVLKVWSGLGYNRRGKYLRDAAKVIVEKYAGKVPRDVALLRTLPGVGPYTASAVRVFAFDEPDVLIETNIRAALIHHFHQGRSLVEDRDILPIAEKAEKEQDPRKWQWALMDYGAHLKRSGVRNNHRSAHYSKQSRFEGSLRQVRGAILRELHKGQQTEQRLRLNLNLEDVRLRKSNMGKAMNKALAGLARDGLIAKRKGKWRIT